MKKIILILFAFLFSCKNENHEYKKNLDHFKCLVKDINTYFIDSKQDNSLISDYFKRAVLSSILIETSI